MALAGLERILVRNPAYDARSLMEGIGPVLRSLLGRMCSDPAYLIPGVQPLAIPAADRGLVTQALAEAVKVCMEGSACG